MGRITAGVRSTLKADRLRFGYRVARLGLIASTVLCALNCIARFFGGFFYSTFTWVFPYAMITDGLFWTGHLYTPGEYQSYWGISSQDFQDPSYLYTMILVALLGLGVLTACCIVSKKHVWGLIVAVSLVVADKLFMLIWYEDSLEFHTDYAMAACLLTVLIIGIVSFFKLRMLEWAGEPVSLVTSQKPSDIDGEAVDSPVLHTVDYGQKSKILMLKSVQGYMICYRKIGNIRELEINKKVYDTVDAGRYGQPHELCAYVGGHEITVGLDVDGSKYMCFDGETVGKVKRGI